MFWTVSTQQQFHIQTAIREGEDSVKISHQRKVSVNWFDMFETVTYSNNGYRLIVIVLTNNFMETLKK